MYSTLNLFFKTALDLSHAQKYEYTLLIDVEACSQIKLPANKKMESFFNLLEKLTKMDTRFALEKVFELLVLNPSSILNEIKQYNLNKYAEYCQLFIDNLSFNKEFQKEGKSLLEEVMFTLTSLKSSNPFSNVLKTPLSIYSTQIVFSAIFHNLCSSKCVLYKADKNFDSKNLFDKASNFLLRSLLANCFVGQYRLYLSLVDKLQPILIFIIKDAKRDKNQIELLSSQYKQLVFFENTQSPFNSEEKSVQFKIWKNGRKHLRSFQKPYLRIEHGE